MPAEQPGQLEQLAATHEKLQPYKENFRELDKFVSQKMADITNKAESYKEKPWYKRLINKIRGKNEPNLTPDQFKKFTEDVKNKINERYSKFVETVRFHVKKEDDKKSRDYGKSMFDKYPVNADFAIKDAMADLRRGLSSLIDDEIRLAAVQAQNSESAGRPGGVYDSQASSTLSLGNMGAVRKKQEDMDKARDTK